MRYASNGAEEVDDLIGGIGLDGPNTKNRGADPTARDGRRTREIDMGAAQTPALNTH
jgi:hypothetical protein